MVLNLSDKRLFLVIKFIGVATLIDLYRRSTLINDFYSLDSILNPIGNIRFFPYQIISAEFWFLLHALIGILLVFFNYSILSLSLNILMSYFLTVRCFYGDLAGNHIFLILQFFLLCILVEKKIKKNNEEIIFIWIYVFQVSVIYLFSFLHKLFSGGWLVSPYSLLNGLKHPFYSSSFGILFSQFYLPVVIANYSILLCQVSSSVALFLYLRGFKSYFKDYAVAALVAFHLFSILLLKLTSFPFICLATLSLVIFVSQEKKQIRIKKPKWFFYTLIFIFLSNLVSFTQNKFSIPYPFLQKWGMMTSSYALADFDLSIYDNSKNFDYLSGIKAEKKSKLNLTELDGRFDYPEWKSFFMRVRTSIFFQHRLLMWTCNKMGNSKGIIDLYLKENGLEKKLRSFDCSSLK